MQEEFHRRERGEKEERTTEAQRAQRPEPPRMTKSGREAPRALHLICLVFSVFFPLCPLCLCGSFLLLSAFSAVKLFLQLIQRLQDAIDLFRRVIVDQPKAQE